MSFLAHSLVLASPRRAILSFCLSPRPRPPPSLRRGTCLALGEPNMNPRPSPLLSSHSREALVWSVRLLSWQVWGKKKKNRPMRGKGRQMNNDCTCFLLLAVQAEEPVTYPFYTSPPLNSPLFPTSLRRVPVKSDIPLCPSKNNQHSAAGCQGSSPPYNRRARWGNQKLSNVKCPLLRLRVRYVFASPTPEPWLQCRCTNSLFINRDH